MEFLEEHQDSEPAPRARVQPAAGPPATPVSGLGPALPLLRVNASPETRLLACLRLSEGQAGSSSLSARMLSLGLAHPGWGSWGLGSYLLSLYSPSAPTLTFALNETWGKGLGA